MIKLKNLLKEDNEKWNPVEKPYRLMHYGPYRDSGAWIARPTTFATKEEALAELAKPFKAGIISGTVTIAINPETWTKNGKWKQIASRKRKPK